VSHGRSADGARTGLPEVGKASFAPHRAGSSRSGHPEPIQLESWSARESVDSLTGCHRWKYVGLVARRDTSLAQTECR
jgi:hypothetical protein